tara:strand:- start:3917 stop:5464 length:1548 start_codon:yes stop_codon:yes gene_type:complete
VTTTAESPAGNRQQARDIAVAQAAQTELCRRYFKEHFLEFVYIDEKPNPLMGIQGGKKKFERWPHLMNLVDSLTEHRLIDLLKARQIGASWTVSAYAAWLLRFFESAQILEFSRGEVEAKNLLKKAKYIYKNLPEYMQLPIGSDSNSEFSIPQQNSSIVAFPSTEDAGRSETATLVIQDEADFHEYLEANYNAVKPTIDAGGQYVMLSSANKARGTTIFKNIFKGAPANGWHPVFFGWDVRPGRDQEWYESRRKEASDSPEAQRLGIDLYMEQEYPQTAEQALAPSAVSAKFNHDALKDMENDIRKPYRIVNDINLYVAPRPNRRYVAASDISKGVGADYSVTVIMDVGTTDIVADIVSDSLEVDNFVEQSVKMLEMYRKPLWAIENTGLGLAAVTTAKMSMYPRLYKRRTRGGRTDIGWNTDEKHRWILWNDLGSLVDSRGLILHNRMGLNQFYDVIKNPQKDGRVEAVQNGHDDYPMAVGIAYQMLNEPLGQSPAQEFNGLFGDNSPTLAPNW